MKFHLQSTNGTNLFTAYDNDYVAVNGVPYKHSLIVTPDRLIGEWQGKRPDALMLEDFVELFNSGIEIVLLGTGAKLRFPPPRLVVELAQRGIGLEAMDTFAACRTYNILAGEGRKVAAVLVIGAPESASPATIPAQPA